MVLFDFFNFFLGCRDVKCEHVHMNPLALDHSITNIIKEFNLNDLKTVRFSAGTSEKIRKDKVCGLYSMDKFCFQTDCPYKHQILQSDFDFDCKIETVDNNSKDFAEVLKVWKTHNTSDKKIQKIEKVINLRLENLFEQRRMMKKSPVKIYGFHGTPESNIPKIAKEGFLKDLQINNAYGKGTYFAHDPKVSAEYCRSQGTKMFLVEIHVESDDSDIIFEKGNLYYIIPEPKGIMPRFIITFQ